MAKFIVTGDQHFGITGQMLEIQRQIRLKSGSPIDPELAIYALQEIIEGKFSDRVVSIKKNIGDIRNFTDGKSLELPVKIWKTITIGGMGTFELKNLIKKDFKLGDDASYMMDHSYFKNPEVGEEVSFAMGTLEDFGFTRHIFKEWQDFLSTHPFYEKCLSSDGPYLRINYSDQPKGQWIRCAMKTLSSSHVFNLVHNDDGMWLANSLCGPNDGMVLDRLWIVRIRKGIITPQ